MSFSATGSGDFYDSNNYAGHFDTPDPAFSSLSLLRVARMNTEHLTEAEKFLQQNPETHEFDLLLPDMNAVLRGKRIIREKLLSIYKKGFYFHIKFEGVGKTIEELEKAENIDEMLIRYLTVRVKKHNLEENFFEKKSLENK